MRFRVRPLRGARLDEHMLEDIFPVAFDDGFLEPERLVRLAVEGHFGGDELDDPGFRDTGAEFFREAYGFLSGGAALVNHDERRRFSGGDGGFEGPFRFGDALAGVDGRICRKIVQKHPTERPLRDFIESAARVGCYEEEMSHASENSYFLKYG